MNVIEIMNTIRDNASADYQARVPEATRNNMEDIRVAIVGDDNIQVANEFMSTLLNKIVKTQLHTKRFENPLKAFKQGKKPIGDGIEEIYANFIKGSQPDFEGANLLKRELPDVKAVYHRQNYSMQYPVTVDRRRLSRAFTSEATLESFINAIIDSLYNSAELDEFANMKQLIASAIDNGAMKYYTVTDPMTGETEGKEFIKDVKTVSTLMTFPSTDYNMYATVSGDTKAVRTFARKDEQVLILDAGVETSLNVDVLASIFNMTVAEFNETKKVVIDAFPTCAKGKIVGALVDKDFFQVYDDFFAITEFFNGRGVYQNYYLNVDQTMAYSILVNAVAFVVAAA